MLKKFRKNADGNVAMLAGFMLLPAIMLLGGSYDVMRATSKSMKLQSVLDSAALAAASLTNAQEVSATVTDYMNANLQTDPVLLGSLNVNVKETSSLNSKNVEISADAVIPTFFMKAVNISSLPVKAKSVAKQSKSTLELALVLDVSSSMRGSKFTKLKEAASDFIDQILTEENKPHTSMSIVPFGGTVNIEPLFLDYAVPMSSAIVDPAESQYDIGSSLLNSSFRFNDGDTCIEHPDGDFDDDLIPALSRSQVPNVWKWWNNHPWCPHKKSAILLNTNNANALTNRINELTLSDGTGMDIGMLWGAKVLSPSWTGKLGGDFSDRPYPYDGEAMKVMIVMTDGEITDQFRPEDPSVGNVHSNRAQNFEANVNSKGANDKSLKNANDGKNANSKNQQTVVSRGNSNSTADQQTAVSHFKRLCSEAKTNNVIVYTIGFQINQNALSHELLGICAADASKYYFVESLDIQAAFDSIAASINALRITG
ncbi:MAG: VWA domain-containing protein [Pseudomonadota bacterium]